jgi:NADH-quinone oxidoreductase subunit N
MIQHFLPLLPELLVVATGLALAFRGRWPVPARRWVPALALVLVAAALALELWLGAALVTWARGAYTQDRFALFGKAAMLFGLLVLIASAGWEGERGEEGLPAACVAALAGMVAVSSTSLPLLWLAVTAAAGAGLAVPIQRRIENRALLAVAAGAAVVAALGLTLVGLQGHAWTLDGLRQGLTGPDGGGLALSAMLAVSGLLGPVVLLPMRALSGEEEPAVQEAVLGSLVGGTAALGSAKLLAALFGAGPEWGPYLAVLAAAGALVCGLAALGAGSLRGLSAWLVAGQTAWVAGALASHDQLGVASAAYLVGGLMLAASAAPLLAAGLTGSRAGMSGLAHRQPWRWLGLSLALLSLAGAPPLAGFFGEFAVAQELLRSQLAWVLAFGLLGSGVGLWAVVRVLVLAWLEPEHDERRLPASGWPLAAGLAGVLLLAYGVLSYPIHGLAVQGAEALGLFR